MDLEQKIDELINLETITEGSCVEESLIYFSENRRQEDVCFELVANEYMSLIKELSICKDRLEVSILKNCTNQDLFDSTKMLKNFKSVIESLSGEVNGLLSIHVSLTPKLTSFRFSAFKGCNQKLEDTIKAVIPSSLKGIVFHKITEKGSEDCLILKINPKKYIEQLNVMNIKEEKSYERTI